MDWERWSAMELMYRRTEGISLSTSPTEGKEQGRGTKKQRLGNSSHQCMSGSPDVISSLVRALAALLRTFLLLVLECGDQLEEGHGLSCQRLCDGLMCLDHRRLDVGMVAVAAARTSHVGLLRLLVSARRLLAHKLALRTRAQGRLLALPVALRLLAHGSAVGVRSRACSAALSRGAHSLALGAVVRLTEILGASDVALGLIAVDLARCARRLLAVHLALGSLAHRVALGRARGIVALPSALRVARSLLALHLSRGHSGHSEQHHKGQQKNVGNLHLDFETAVGHGGTECDTG